MNYITSVEPEQAEDDIVACELLHAAFHEAGHKIIYERFGGAGDAAYSGPRI